MYRRTLLAALPALALAACGASRETLPPNPDPIGDFSLGYNIVVVDKPEIGPFSRKATDDEWKASLEQAIDQRFSRFKGAGTYHVALKVQLYALAQPGIPIAFSPKSVLLISANVWSQQGKLNPAPENITVWESVSDKTIVGSGLTQSKEEQMRNLSFNAAARVEDWMRKHPEWFRPGAPVVAGTQPKGAEVQLKPAEEAKAQKPTLPTK